MSEQELLNHLQSGTEESFRKFYAHFSKRVYNTALKFLYNVEDAEEITQDVFVEVFRSEEQFKGDSTLSTWVYRITVNKSLDKLKHRKRKKRWAFVQSLFTSEEEQPITSVDFKHPGILLEEQEYAQHLFAAIEKLPQKQQEAFVLFEMEGQNYEAIAAIMASTKSSVESLLFRARKNLKDFLSDYYEKNLR